MNLETLDPKHQAIIISVARNHQMSNQSVMRLYVSCLSVFQGKDKPEADVYKNRAVLNKVGKEKSDLVVATCTDGKTGFFIQLSGTITADSLSLSCGQKWAMEISDPRSSMTSTKMW